MTAPRLFALLLLALPGPAAEPPYTWPLSFDNGVSSTFMEFRSNHFHAGIDLRTYRETGFPVLALADGAVERIRMAVNDTGRSLYLRLADGRLAVYYHLQGFIPALEEISRGVQRESGERYFGEYRLPHPFPVRRGEVVAYSGETGAGFAHLHLEIRDADDRALNPLRWLPDRSPDTFAPVPGGLLVRSRAGSLVNGEIGEAVVRFQPDNGAYVLREPLLVDGPVDFELAGWDVSSGRHAVAPYSIEARLDGRPFYTLTGDTLAWEENNRLGTIFDMARSGMGTYYYNLNAQPDPDPERGAPVPAPVPLVFGPGRHQLQFVLRDIAGNSATAIAEFDCLPPPAADTSGAERDISVRDLPFRQFINGNDLMVCLDEWPAAAEQVALKVLQGGNEAVYKARVKKNGVYFVFQPLNAEARMQLRFMMFRDAVEVSEIQKSQTVAVLLPGVRRDLQLEGCRLSFAENSVDVPRVLLIEQPPDLPADLPMLAPAVSLAPNQFTFRDTVTVSFPVGTLENPEQVGVFKFNPHSRRWSYVKARLETTGNIFGARILMPATYALFRDAYPPVVSLGRVRRRSLSRLKWLHVRIRDLGMGVRGESVRVVINGQPNECDYDADWQGVRITRLEALHKGNNRLLVTASDLAGNKTTAELQLRLR